MANKPHKKKPKHRNTDLATRYSKIGIKTVAAAARFEGNQKLTDTASQKKKEERGGERGVNHITKRDT
jgi:hypothetical protein